MDMTYNNTRGIEQFKKKMTESLQKRRLSQDDIEKCILKAIEMFGSKIGVMPIDGVISAVSAVAAIEKHISNKQVHEIFDAISSFSIDGINAPVAAQGGVRLQLDDVRDVGKEVDTTLDEVAQEIHEGVEDNDNLVEVVAYNFDGTPAKTLSVSSIDMTDYMEEEDLTDEGKRQRGFLPPDFDSTDVLSNPVETQGRSRSIGNYGHDEQGQIFIQCPVCLSKDAAPLGAGTYMCLSCDDAHTFDVDLLLDDINPEMN